MFEPYARGDLDMLSFKQTTRLIVNRLKRIFSRFQFSFLSVYTCKYAVSLDPTKLYKKTKLILQDSWKWYISSQSSELLIKCALITKIVSLNLPMRSMKTNIKSGYKKNGFWSEQSLVGVILILCKQPSEWHLYLSNDISTSDLSKRRNEHWAPMAAPSTPDDWHTSSESHAHVFLNFISC